MDFEQNNASKVFVTSQNLIIDDCKIPLLEMSKVFQMTPSAFLHLWKIQFWSRNNLEHKYLIINSLQNVINYIIL